ncbi:MAG: low molecular weight phosphatase family protein [Anaerolineae bacterium]|nr:low molecular weight phosphatase family protein [Anaerolineae bacterium]
MQTEQNKTQPKKTILFLCPHHAAKSVLAEAYFNRAGLSEFQAVSAGTEPDEAVMPSVATMLGEDGIDVSNHRPRRVTAEELHRAAKIISMGCTAEALGVDVSRIEIWSDVPPVSQDPHGAQQAILAHIEQLIQEL